MDLGIVRAITTKDLSVVRRKKSIFYGTVALPLAIGLGLPAILWLGLNRSGSAPTADVLDALKNTVFSFSFWFVIGASVLPGAIASYSIVGEKVEKSLEPLLATPARDSEILLGKSIAALIPSLIGIFAGGGIFTVMIDAVMTKPLGYLLLPNWTFCAIMLVLVPITVVFSVEVNVLISSRVTDVRTANTLTGLMSLPFGVIYVVSLIGVFQLDVRNILIISFIIAVASIILFNLTRITFRREEILTKWR